ncbi:MAG TPA: MCP four helix bundle domain-containing protein [Ignavibacteriales bacterium]|nr:MCP four helix bundle domain-containing protein [Ignavibacteriales bacterium]
MSWFKNLPVGKKFIYIFGVIIVLTAYLSYYSITNILYLKDNGTELYETGAKPLSELSELLFYVGIFKETPRDALLDPDKKEFYIEKRGDASKNITRLINSIEKTQKQENVLNKIKEYKNIRAVLLPQLNRYEELLLNNNIEEAKNYFYNE